MSETYAELKGKIDGVKETLLEKARHLEAITPEDRVKYPNPQLRIWSGDIRNLSSFATGLDEWLSAPQVAEARRLLSELIKWAEEADKLPTDDVYRDWRFLSDNVSTIERIHGDTGTIPYDGIRKKVASWVLNRIIEKDLDYASRWAGNARQFVEKVKDLQESTSVGSKLADKVRKDSTKELLKVTSYDKDNEELVEEYRRLIEQADDLIRNRPQEIGEKAILNTYEVSDEIERSLDKVSEDLGKIRRLLVDLEWVVDFRGFDDFKNLWSKKKAAYRAKDLESIHEELNSLLVSTNTWKGNVKRRIESSVAKVRRMSRSLPEGDIKSDINAIEARINSITWNKPDLKLLLEVSGKTDELLRQLRAKLVEKLRNEDAILIIEDPEIIDNMGEKLGWDFDRFIKALEVVLRYGLIEIRAAEEA